MNFKELVTYAKQVAFSNTNKKGQMFQNLTGVAIGLVVFAIIIVVGSVIVLNLGNAVGGRPNTTADYLLTQLGSSSGGLASWTPAIIAVVIGALFIALIIGGFGKATGR